MTGISQLWPWFFSFFRGGADWYLERPLAEDAMEIWRKHTIAARHQYKRLFANWDKRTAIPAARPISDYYPG